MTYSLAMIIGYALGSIPFPYLLGKVRGIDIYTVGTGNPGAANLFRQVSKPLGVLAAVLDIAKGALAVMIGKSLGLTEAAVLLPGAAAVIGQWHPAVLRFRGGEGLATAVGVCLAALPIPATVGIVLGVAALALLRNTGRAAALGWAAFLSLAAAGGAHPGLILGLLFLGAMILARSSFKAVRARRHVR